MGWHPPRPIRNCQPAKAAKHSAVSVEQVDIIGHEQYHPKLFLTTSHTGCLSAKPSLQKQQNRLYLPLSL